MDFLEQNKLIDSLMYKSRLPVYIQTYTGLSIRKIRNCLFVVCVCVCVCVCFFFCSGDVQQHGVAVGYY
jgi:hypothetical protein